jgi:hypothetical protein
MVMMIMICTKTLGGTKKELGIKEYATINLES